MKLGQISSEFRPILCEFQRNLGVIVIRITRQYARRAAFYGFFGLIMLAAALVGRPDPAAANYQSGVDAYYRGDFAGAMEAWRPLAEAGDAVAQNSIGALYDHGLGVPEDNYEAARWYEMAAQLGLPLAMRNLANQYATGHGMPYDVDMARQWYEKAAGLGDQQSVSLLRQLKPAAPVVATSTPTFAAPTTTGSLATPVESNTAAATAGAATSASAAGSAGAGDLVISDMGGGQDTVLTAPSAALPDQGVALDIGGQTVTMGSTSQAAQPVAQPSAEPVAQQQTAMVTPPPAPRADGNWLVGQWQGPSLGCPKEGGMEFSPKEAITWFAGEVALRMAAIYQISGDDIAVTTTAGDGSTQTYGYRRENDERMIITAVPEGMTKSMVGVVYRRCGAAPADPATVQNVIEIPANGQIPAAPVATATTQAAPATPAVAPTGATAADGWDAFERGDPQLALAIFKNLAEAGDSNMQAMVGQIYDFGQGVPQDDAEALKWYLRAAEAGNPKGQYQAGVLYFRSQGVPQNLVESYRWLTVAAEGKTQGLEVNPNQSVSIQAKSMLNDVARQMSDSDIAKAKQLAKSTN